MSAGSRHELVAQMLSMTGASEEFCRSFLETSDWNLGAAVDAFFAATGGAEGSRPSKRRKVSSTREVVDLSSSSAPESMQEPMGEDGVRAPIPHKVDVLMGGAHLISNQHRVDHLRDYRADLSRGKGKVWASNPLAKLFAPPTEIMFLGGFEQLCMCGKAESKWLLVNLMDAGDFQCHTLNRDTWSDDDLKVFIQAYFLFWQQDHKTQDGRLYCSRYRLTSDAKVPPRVPHVAVIDPRTRQKMWAHSGPITAPELKTKLRQFLKENDFECSQIAAKPVVHHAPPLPSPSSSSNAPMSTAARQEAEALERAIQASLRESSADVVPIEDLASESEHEEELPAATSSSAPPPPATWVAEPLDDQEATRLQLRMKGGKVVRRRFRKDQPVKGVYDFVRSLFPGEIFNIFSSFPKRLVPEDETTLQSAGLLNCALVVEWEH